MKTPQLYIVHRIMIFSGGQTTNDTCLNVEDKRTTVYVCAHTQFTGKMVGKSSDFVVLR